MSSDGVLGMTAATTGGGEPEFVGSHDDDTRLERRYRRLLGLLPQAYREARGEEMLGALMDGAPAGRRWPKPAEALSLAALGVRVRSGARGELPGREALRPLARAVALTATLLFAFFGVQEAVELLRYWPRNSSPIMDVDGHTHSHVVVAASLMLDVLWLFILVALVLGWRRTARVLAAGAPLLVAPFVDGPRSFIGLIPSVGMVLTIVVGTPRGFPAMRRPVRLAAVVAPLAVLGWYVSEDPFGEPLGLSVLRMAPIAAGLLAVLAFVVRRARQAAVWPLALAVVVGLEIAWLSVQQVMFNVLSLRSARLEAELGYETCLILVAGYALVRERRALRRETVDPVRDSL